MLRPSHLLAIAATLLPWAAAAQVNFLSEKESTPAPSVDVSERRTLPGMRAYYEPHQIERVGDTRVFRLYRYGKPGVADEVGRYMLDCNKREASQMKQDRTLPLGKVLPGEDLYVIGKHLCDWDKKNLIDRALDQRQI